MIDTFLMLNGNEIRDLLRGREDELIALVRRIYEVHHVGQSVLPPSSFLRLPHDSLSRIIALPAFLGGDYPVAGLKWIASFPKNPATGRERASAVIILNSIETGLPTSIVEGSIISAVRTAASAALAAVHLRVPGPALVLGLIGCGRINLEIARFICAALGVTTILLYDINSRQLDLFRQYLAPWGLRVEHMKEHRDVLASAQLVSFATTAITPYVQDISMCGHGTTLLNISLRDLAPEAILAADNVVDDIDHACRESTSVHMAAIRTGDRSFIRCTLAEVLTSQAIARRDAATPVIFSPFGLGVLDVGIADYVVGLARRNGIGNQITDFHPTPWFQL
jgi:2,3-diaminopropionate biosynthesis protein SbnB